MLHRSDGQTPPSSYAMIGGGRWRYAKGHSSSNCSPQTADATSLDVQMLRDPAQLGDHTAAQHKGMRSETCSKMFACNASGSSRANMRLDPSVPRGLQGTMTKPQRLTTLGWKCGGRNFRGKPDQVRQRKNPCQREPMMGSLRYGQIHNCNCQRGPKALMCSALIARSEWGDASPCSEAGRCDRD